MWTFQYTGCWFASELVNFDGWHRPGADPRIFDEGLLGWGVGGSKIWVKIHRFVIIIIIIIIIITITMIIMIIIICLFFF